MLGFLDDSRSADELVAVIPVLGPLRLAWDGAPTTDRFVVAIGNPVLRQRVVIHPSACVHQLSWLPVAWRACQQRRPWFDGQVSSPTRLFS